jgi:hypothetical protein
VIVHCAQCQTEVPPPGEKCPACGSEDIMVGMYTPSGMKVSAQRDAKRMRVQARHGKDGKTEYVFSVGGSHPRQRPASFAPVAPHIKMYNDVIWSHDRQQMERREILVNSDEDYYKQEWFSLETGERTYFKEGRLGDPEMHGKSARRGRAS